MNKRLLLFFLLTLSFIISFAQENRLALVIGNSRYDEESKFRQITNCANDAEDVSSKLKALGFDVMKYPNATYDEMRKAIDEFINKSSQYDVALFYYSGHGIQSDDINFLIPTNARNIKSESDLRDYSINANQLVRELEDVGCKLRIIVLDACRNNNLPGKSRESKNGLAKMTAPLGTIIAYATRPNETAIDGNGQRNSPYTKAFLSTLDIPNLNITEFFEEVGYSVVESTEEQQIPVYEKTSSRSRQQFVFNRRIVNDKKDSIAEMTKMLSNQIQSATSQSAISSNKKTYTVNGVSFTMVKVAGGTFTMGSPNRDRNAFDGEKPAHQVTLSDYYIGETEVTQELWQAVMGSNSSHFQGNLQCPVEQVSWNDCQEFIRKLNLLTGATFRLPTEAEWEYAARGGSQSRGYKYSGSNKLRSVAWYEDNSSNTTHPVKGKQPNELGLYDMSGNVYEWCADWYDSSYYTSSPQTNPTGPSSGSYRVIRGGTWSFIAMSCRVTDRSYNSPSNAYRTGGFRLSLSSFHKVSSSVISAANKINGHEYVDLGLSVKWATCNVGASSPSDYGNYYAWGETKTKSDYNYDTYEYDNGKYIDIGSDISGTKYDAARANWGGNWRMPTKAELDELRNDCAWSWTSVNGIEGYKVTGPNGNSIFLPAAGYRLEEDILYDGIIGYYWSATLYKDISDDAYFLYFFDGDNDWNYYHRGYGRTVRPVTE